jgi:anti-sigma B factor antagonist
MWILSPGSTSLGHALERGYDPGSLPSTGFQCRRDFMASLDIVVNEIDGVAILRLKGFLNADTSPQFEESLQRLIDKAVFKIIVDFQKLEYISSAGVGCFIGNIKRVRKNGGDIRFLSMPAKTQRVFQLLDFQDFFQSFQDENLAVQSFRV